MSATRTLARDVSQENRQDHPVVQHLQRQVANAFVLYANYKHYHWQTFGPLFRDFRALRVVLRRGDFAWAPKP